MRAATLELSSEMARLSPMHGDVQWYEAVAMLVNPLKHMPLIDVIGLKHVLNGLAGVSSVTFGHCS